MRQVFVFIYSDIDIVVYTYRIGFNTNFGLRNTGACFCNKDFTL